MTNCAVTGAPKVSEKGRRPIQLFIRERAHRSGCLTTVPPQEFERGCPCLQPACSWACLAFNAATTSHVTSVMALPLCYGARKIIFIG